MRPLAELWNSRGDIALEAIQEADRIVDEVDCLQNSDGEAASSQWRETGGGDGLTVALLGFVGHADRDSFGEFRELVV